MSLGYPFQPELLYFAIVGFAAALAVGIYLWRDSRRRGIDVWWVSFAATLGPIAAVAGAALAIAELAGVPLLPASQFETMKALLWLSVIAGAAMLIAAMFYSGSAGSRSSGGMDDLDDFDVGADTMVNAAGGYGGGTAGDFGGGEMTPAPMQAQPMVGMGGGSVMETMVLRPKGAVDGAIAWLTVLTEPHRGQEIALGTDAVIGRDGRTCQIVLDDDRVSNLHARIQYTSDERFVLRDLGSSNGTYVNGTMIDAPYDLDDHDTIRLGDAELEFFWVRQAADVPSDMAYRGSLLLQTGPRRGDSIPVNQDKLLLGSSKVCDIQLGDDGVASVHAVITRDGESYILSSSGDAAVMVNGSAKEQVTLSDRDEIALGDARLIFRDGREV